MAWPEYKGKTVGFAKVMGELPVSDGTVAYEIMNFTATPTGFLENKFKLMPLIPNEWNTEGKEGDTTSQPTELNKVLAMQYLEWDGESPELLLLSTQGVFRFDPSNRTGELAYGSTNAGDTSSNGLVEQFYYTEDNVKTTIKPQGTTMFPPQTEVVGNRVYFTFCDGGGAYVWDGSRLRDFGYSVRPSTISALGPRSNRGTDDSNPWKNGGGFSVQGRIGTLNYNLTSIKGSDPGFVVTTGGIEAGLWYYAVVYENEDGAYSSTSDKSSRVNIQFHVAPAATEANNSRHGIQYLRRSFWLNNIPKGPAGTVARIILRTMNLSSLPSGEVGNLRFVHRLPNNSATEYLDDIPDSELGSEWDGRRSVPTGFYFMKFFNGSMFLLRTEKHPSRVWWSEQGAGVGSVPESFIGSQWRDVFPETGPITGSLPVSLGGKQSLLVFKESATHYVGGAYAQPGTEGWVFGTISSIAGCSGPNLSQASPDGQVVWYGNGTFWMLDTAKGGGAVDVGASIRKRLKKINAKYARFGSSWVDKRTKEMVFCLPFEDSTTPDLQFVWDYLNRGWRLRQDMKVHAVEQIEDMTLLSGSWQGRVGARGLLGEVTDVTQATNTIWVYQRGYPNYDPGSDLTCTYTSGWMSLMEFGPSFHASQRAADSVFTMQERSARIATVSTYADWDFDNPISNDLEVSLIHPENDGIDVYTGDDALTVQETTNSTTALYGDDEARYRDSRTYTHRLPIDIPSCTVFSLSLKASCINDPMAIISIDAYGPISSGAATRSPALYEK